jgi:hypothetical protein
LLQSLCNRSILTLVAVALVVLSKVLSVCLLLEEGFVLLPRNNQLPRLDVINQTGIRIYPLDPPLVATNVFNNPNTLE